MHAPSTYPAQMDAADPRFASVDCVFFCIGAQKAGTTWLNRYLREHPNASVPYWKENNYWNMVDGRPDPGRMLIAQRERRKTEGAFRKMVAGIGFTLHAKRQKAITLALKAAETPYAPHTAYADLILENAGKDTRAAGEICPEYALLSAECFARMYALQPNVRFIYLMRDPVSRFVSGVRHSLRKTFSGKALSADAFSEALLKNAAARYSRPHQLSDYGATMTALEQHVPRDRILYVFFEDLFSQEQLENICEFLGLPFRPGDTGTKRNVAGKNANPVSAADQAALARALRPVYEFIFDRFGEDVPRKWRESAALCG